MKKIYFIIILIVIAKCAYSQKVEPTWESINKRPYPSWFSEAKLGIFIHWGLYSVPALCGKEQYAEWFYRGLMLKDSLRQKFINKQYGHNFTYTDFNALFKAELFNADEWAELFYNSGAKYVVLVTKHHDGYCLWDSKYAKNWNSVEGGPKRNIVSELTESVKEKGLKMGFYYSLPEWTHPLHIWMQDKPENINNYVEKHMIPQFKELVSQYKPSLIFSDGEWYNTAEQWHATELISWYYNLVGEEAIVNDRWGAGSLHGFRTPEYSSAIMDTTRPWAECRGLGRSFGLNRNEPITNYLTVDELIKHFVKLVAAGGGLTLNVGPAADGQIPLFQQERLLELGKWLKTNGEAIYATKPFVKFYEYKDVKIERIDKQINFNWVRNAPDKEISYDNFNVKWTGYLKADYSENYNFEIDVDDEAKVIINDQLIIDKTENKNINKPIFLKEGEKNKIEIQYSEKIQEAKIKLYWASKTQNKEIINEEKFFISKDKDTKGLNGVYTCVQPNVCYTTKNNVIYAIALDFPDDYLKLNINIKGIKNVSFLDNGKNLKFEKQNDGIYIDTKTIKYNDVKSRGAWVFKIEY